MQSDGWLPLPPRCSPGPVVPSLGALSPARSGAPRPQGGRQSQAWDQTLLRSSR